METTALKLSEDWWTERWIEPVGLRASAFDPDSDALPDQLGSMGGIQRDLGRGLHLYTLAANMHAPASSTHTSSEPYLWFAVSLASNSRFDHAGKLSGDVKAGAAYCSLLREGKSIVSYGTGVHSAGGLAITRDRLAQLLEGQLVEGPLKAFLTGRFDPMVAHFCATPEARAIINQLFSHPYHGPMEAIYLEAKAYELLAENLRAWADQSGAETLSRARRNAHKAREFMMANLASPPSMLEVARQVGLSQRALTNVFHEVYGASPLQCFNTWRLEAAKGLLRSGEYSVKQVAHLIGYSHASNFSLAFTRQFGHPPTGVCGE